jgi:hypothetical protein
MQSAVITSGLTGILDIWKLLLPAKPEQQSVGLNILNLDH